MTNLYSQLMKIENSIICIIYFYFTNKYNDLILHFKISKDFKCRSVAYGHNKAIWKNKI